MVAVYNPLDPRVAEDPYPSYHALRRLSPVLWIEMLQAWVLTAYDDVNAVLKDHVRFSSDRSQAANAIMRRLQEEQDQGLMRRTASMLNCDPPSHTRMRNLCNKAFTPRRVEAMRSHIEDIAESLLDSLPDPARVDVVRDLATPLPVIVIAEMLGVSTSDREQFKAWSSDMARTLGTPFQSHDLVEKARRSSQELADYFRTAIAERKRQPRDDLLSALIAAEEQGDLLSEEELLVTLVLLLVAGNETTTNLIGNGMLALLRHPEQRRRLQAEPLLLTSAVEEMLRYDSPVQATTRVVTRPLTIGGKKMEPGHSVLVVLGAANRDPAQFEDPDRFDVGRRDVRHVAFGYGIHFCLGAPLARVEAPIAIAALLRRFPEPALEVDKPEWAQSFILRGLQGLPLRNAGA